MGNEHYDCESNVILSTTVTTHTFMENDRPYYKRYASIMVSLSLFMSWLSLTVVPPSCWSAGSLPWLSAPHAPPLYSH